MRFASWGYEEGIILSGEDVIQLLKVLSPEWEPIPSEKKECFEQGSISPEDLEEDMWVTYRDGEEEFTMKAGRTHTMRLIKDWAKQGHIYPYTEPEVNRD